MSFINDCKKELERWKTELEKAKKGDSKYSKEFVEFRIKELERLIQEEGHG